MHYQLGYFILFIGLFAIAHNAKLQRELHKTTNKELIQTHVIFRHGERTTYKYYPTDPHINNTYYPIGLGGLTNNGKMGEYQLGQFFREHYGKLLSPLYFDDELDVRSTNTERTIMSAQLVLAGLYPPAKLQQWHPHLPWQPIPVFSKLREDEDILHPEVCAKKLAAYDNLPSRPEVYETFIKPYEKLFEFVETKSGMPIRSPQDLLEFYFIVNTEDDLKLTLPTWVHQVYPEKIYAPASLTYSFLNYDVDLKKINVGYLMNKIINDTLAFAQDAKSAKKMYLYSGHESTLGFLLFAMNVLQPHVPPYGSAIMIDIFRDFTDHDIYVKINYRNSSTASAGENLMLPGCRGQIYCPLNTFIELQSEYLPTESIQDACKLPNDAKTMKLLDVSF